MAKTFHLQVDSTAYVQIFPNWDFARPHIKNQSQHETRTGKLFTYKWGERRLFELECEYVDQTTRAIVNSWWWTNTQLLFIQDGVTVRSVTIINDNIPFAENQKPYKDLYKGNIKLSTY